MPPQVKEKTSVSSEVTRTIMHPIFPMALNSRKNPCEFMDFAFIPPQFRVDISIPHGFGLRLKPRGTISLSTIECEYSEILTTFLFVK